MSENDLIRRGDVERLLRSLDVHGDGERSLRDYAVGLVREMIPADPWAAAAEELAQATEAYIALTMGGPSAFVAAAKRIRAALAAWRTLAKPEPACTCVGMTVPWHDATCARAGIFTPGDAGAAFAKSAKSAPGVRDVEFVMGSAPERCPEPDCLDGHVPSQPDGEPEPCPRCAKGGSHD